MERIGKVNSRRSVTFGIGINNLGAIALRKPDAVIQPFDPNGSDAEFTGYKAKSMLTLLAPALSKAGPAGVFGAEAKQTTATTAEMSRIRELGQQGQLASGVVRNTERIESVTGTAKYRIPDGLNRTTKTIDEVKNVRYQALTNQIKDSMYFAQRNGFHFSLYLRPKTQISRQLANEIAKGHIDPKRLNPGGHKFLKSTASCIRLLWQGASPSLRANC